MRRFALLVMLLVALTVPVWTTNAQPSAQIYLPIAARELCPRPPECLSTDALERGWVCEAGRLVPWCALRGLCPYPTPRPAE